eukprot:6953991-Pyramimonas_sp.AAC.1
MASASLVDRSRAVGQLPQQRAKQCRTWRAARCDWPSGMASACACPTSGARPAVVLALAAPGAAGLVVLVWVVDFLLVATLPPCVFSFRLA